MSELFDEEDKVIDSEAGVEIEIEVEVAAEEEDVEDITLDHRPRPASDARRRLENMLEDKRLRDELEDFLDF